MTYRIIKSYTDPSMQRLLEWTASMLTAAASTANKIGCSPSAVVAQAAQETGWGKSAIGNNVFGIKADAGWKGARQLRRTWESVDGKVVYVDAWFRDYPTLADGITDHFEFLRDNGYATAFDPDGTMSDEEYFIRMAEHGYATDPDYAKNLCEVLDSVNGFMDRMIDDERPSVPALPRVLLIGCIGEDVAKLQHSLNITADGDFGPLTKVAVMRYQHAHGLETDGIVGSITRSLLEV